jgi:hypothetical protein
LSKLKQPTSIPRDGGDSKSQDGRSSIQSSNLSAASFKPNQPPKQAIAPNITLKNQQVKKPQQPSINFNLSSLVPTCVDKITEEQEKMAKAREMHRLNELERKRKQEEQEEERDQVPLQMLKHQDSQYAINQTLSKMNERIESAKRKMEKHSKIAVKRESTDFYEASDSKPRIEVAGGDSTGATKATGGRMSIGSDVTPMNSGV